MNGLLAAGTGLTLLGVGGYVLGILSPYPGRAFSVTVVMIGITLIGVHNVDGGDDT